MPGAPLSLPEREEIALALTEDREVSWAVLGRRIGRHPTTAQREVERNGGRERYRPVAAERRAGEQRCRPRPRRLEAHGALRERVIAELALGRSPEAIWSDLVAECHLPATWDHVATGFASGMGPPSLPVMGPP